MTRRASWPVVVAVFLLAAAYGVRAVEGVLAGSAFARGVPLARAGDYDRALPLLERGAEGEDRFEALWLAAEVRLGMWDYLEADSRAASEGLELLQDAMRGYLEASNASPSSAWPLAGLALVYERLEALDARSRVFDLSRLSAGPWAVVGHDGVIALGLTRAAIEREPNVFPYRDQLVRLLLAMRLDALATEEIAGAAKVQPRFGAHDPEVFGALEERFLRAFAESSERAVGEAPLLSRERHLLSLARLRHRLGDLERADRLFIAASKEPATRLQRAEQAFHHGLLLIDMGELDRARRALLVAAEEDVLQPAAFAQLASIEVEQGEFGRALEHLSRARTLRPRSVDYCLRYARLASDLGEFSKAFEALRWARVIAPNDLRVVLELGRLSLQTGDLAEASRALRAAESLAPNDRAVLAFRQRYESGGGG